MVKYTMLNYNCQTCGTINENVTFPHDKAVRCRKCHRYGVYWHNQLILKDYKSPKVPAFCVGVICFWPARLRRFLKFFKKHSLGTPADVYFIHNVFDRKDVTNRLTRTPEQVAEVRNLLQEFSYPNKVVLERENVGEDLGAAHFLFHLFKEKYQFYFFLNEVADVRRNKWLKPFHDTYQRFPEVAACGPKVLRNGRLPKHRYIICTTYWSLRTSFALEMNWPAPLNRFQSKAQEMELVYHQANKKGLKIAQVGKGDDLLHYNNIPANWTVGSGRY